MPVHSRPQVGLRAIYRKHYPTIPSDYLVKLNEACSRPEIEFIGIALT